MRISSSLYEEAKKRLRADQSSQQAAQSDEPKDEPSDEPANEVQVTEQNQESASHPKEKID